jgi:hypothetical protein
MDRTLSTVGKPHRQPKRHVGFRPWTADARHIIYEHDNTPHSLDVVCPRCGRLAFARNRDWVGSKQGSFEVRCSHCPLRQSQVPYQELPALFYRAAARGAELWAWNREHLLQLLSFLENPHLKGASAHRAYVRRDWLIRRKSLAKAIRAML